MTDYLELLIGTIILSFGIYYVSYKIFNTKIKVFSLYNISIVLLYGIIITALSMIAYDNFFRVICNAILVTFMNQIVFKQRVIKTVIGSFITIAIISISEALWVTILAVLSKLNIEQLKVQYFLDLWTNIGITVLMIINMKIKPIVVRIQKLINSIYLKKKIGTIIWVFCSISCLFLLLYCIYFHLPPVHTFIICLFVTVCYTCLPLVLFKEKSDRYKLQIEYNNVIKNLKDYEQILDNQRMKNHENDNNLSAIRGMINPENREAIEFIDSLTKKEKSNDKNLLLKTKDIPSGGLQGLICQKILLMDQKKYQYTIEISKELKKIKMNKMETSDIKDMCAVTGVFIDNAIQAVEECKKKLVGIYLYKDGNNLVISISNNFNGNLEIEKFDEKGYTTKKQGHGYGLSLVKEIINRNAKMTNIRTIHGNIFNQILKIEIK